MSVCTKATPTVSERNKDRRMRSRRLPVKCQQRGLSFLSCRMFNPELQHTYPPLLLISCLFCDVALNWLEKMKARS